ncbi:Crp/Fnr family transcriptional regulator [Pseudooceanicola nitratireducens]|uniref:Crp/Fnr family transcriptional regulator n=1 Tax=Pseudooceanicola nitratireducens TaxID=517719 RepID=UPI0021BC18BD|nr:Crp/Fnr family transcriptional regulator [Pseudooceanicola nitratireducens]
MAGHPLICDAGTVLFSPGMPCTGFVVLEEGTIRVTMTGTNGREVVLYRVTPGDVCLQTFGCLMDGRDYAAEGVAETAIRGHILPPGDFRRQLAEDEGFRDRLLGAVARRFHDFEQLVEDVALTGFDARLSRALLRLGRDHDDIQVTHEGLAAETASGRAFVSRRLAEFQRRGLIRIGRGHVTLLDRAALGRLAED